MGFSMSSFFMNLGATAGPNETSVNSITLFVLLLTACIVIGHLLEKSRWMTESITALAIGLCTGIVILLTTKGKSSHVLVFSEDLFFIYLLPPIIFNAGFQVKKKQFFRNFMTITLFGAVGTLISFTIISLGSMQLFKKLDIGFLEIGDYLAIGAIFSATDSVCTLQVLNQEETPLLYSVVFGEGVLNDATSVVGGLLTKPIVRFLLPQQKHSSGIISPDFSSSKSLNLPLLGINGQEPEGNISTNITRPSSLRMLWTTPSHTVHCYWRKFDDAVMRPVFGGRGFVPYIPGSPTETEGIIQHSTDREVALMMLMAYLSYMMAELFYLSGILTVFFCGIVMSHYTWHNVTESSRITTKHSFATLSFVLEIFIFLYVGMDALDMEKWEFAYKSPKTSVGVSSILLALVLIGRAAFVFPLCFISNLTKKSQGNKIRFKQQVTIWWAGLMRGAVSVALAYNQFASSGHTQLPGNAIMITSTITVVLFTTVVRDLIPLRLKSPKLWTAL
ncbi:sodium/hydrogen exchanger 2 [Quercus suber]|uniref:Sodium/hydrogen exchanger 2 n=1 Tax=Quercus suber TaxID=58331 RepID=A0AAW0KHX5_QUESU